jgi:predicted unusual protein kinase regulating ubiquinone biosynthesis (AarF/ABC1/UbiB family)
MTRAARKTWPRASLKTRRREVRRCLEECGFSRGRIRLWRGPRPEGDAAPPSQRFRTALEKLGPVFGSFGAYLRSRSDLVPPALCADLPTSPGFGVLPVGEVHEIVFRELGRAPADVFATFAECPAEVGLLYQCHHACLHDGSPVVVKVVKPRNEEELAADLEALDLLGGEFADEEAVRQGMKRAAADFRYIVELQADLVHEARALEALARDSEAAGPLYVPRVHKKLRTKRLLILERLTGWTLQEILSSAENPPWNLDLRDLASHLCTVWLRQALLGEFFPVEPEARTVLVLPDGRLVFTGALTALQSGTKRELWGYLAAAAAEDPDRACLHLLRVLEKDGRSAAEEELRHQLRQVVLFRDGAGEGLAELLKVHGRLAAAHGWRVSPGLGRFNRGIALVNETAGRLAPGRDLLRDGLENVRVQAAIDQFRELLSIEQWNRNLEQYAPALLELPKRWDEALTVLAEGYARLPPRAHQMTGQRSSPDSTAVGTALLLVLAGIALVTHHLAQAGALGGWGDRIGTVAFVVVSVWLLSRFIGRR